MKVINVPFTMESTENELGEIIIQGKRVVSFISKKNVFPGFLMLYNWHELCPIAKVFFYQADDVQGSIIGIGLHSENLIIQIHEKSYPRHIQVTTPCPMWIIERYKEAT